MKIKGRGNEKNEKQVKMIREKINTKTNYKNQETLKINIVLFNLSIFFNIYPPVFFFDLGSEMLMNSFPFFLLLHCQDDLVGGSFELISAQFIPISPKLVLH